MNPVKWCETCGAKMMEYRHTLSKPLMCGLYKLYREAGCAPLNIKHIPLTHNERCNFQKLRYFDLVWNKSKTGVWEVSDLGKRFLFGEAQSRRVAVTYRGERVGWEGPLISFRDVTGYYFTREEYADEATPHEEPV